MPVNLDDTAAAAQQRAYEQCSDECWHRRQGESECADLCDRALAAAKAAAGTATTCLVTDADRVTRRLSFQIKVF